MIGLGRMSCDEGIIRAPELARLLREQVPKFTEAAVPLHLAGLERQILARALDEGILHSFRVVALIAAGLALLSAMRRSDHQSAIEEIKIRASSLGGRTQAGGTT